MRPSSHAGRAPGERIVQRLVRAFVAPADDDTCDAGQWRASDRPGGEARRPRAAPATRVAVLATPDRAAAVGGAVALALGGGPAVVGLWGASVRGPRAPASPGARRIAAKLADRGHDAVATGRLVVATLEAPEEAARIAAAVDVPCVGVVAAARDARVDRVLRGHDRVLVAGEDLVAALAVQSARTLGVSAETLALPDAVTARALASAGVALVAPWRALVEAAVQ